MSYTKFSEIDPEAFADRHFFELGMCWSSIETILKEKFPTADIETIKNNLRSKAEGYIKALDW